MVCAESNVEISSIERGRKKPREGRVIGFSCLFCSPADIPLIDAVGEESPLKYSYSGDFDKVGGSVSGNYKTIPLVLKYLSVLSVHLHFSRNLHEEEIP